MSILIGLPTDELFLPVFAPYVAITCVMGSLLYVIYKEKLLKDLR